MRLRTQLAGLLRAAEASLSSLPTSLTQSTGVRSAAAAHQAQPLLQTAQANYDHVHRLSERNARLEAFRNSLPPLPDILRQLAEEKEAVAAQRASDASSASSQPQSDLSWRDCVAMSRRLYATEVAARGEEATHATFASYLRDRYVSSSTDVRSHAPTLRSLATLTRYATLARSFARAMTDSFARRHTYLRISISEKCSLRCVYCMPEGGVDLTPSAELLTVDEIERLVQLFALAGVTKVRLTGGEPTIRRDLPDIVKRISSVPGIRDVGITSNGLVLASNGKLRALRDNGLTLLNLSLDTLDPERFVQLTRRKGHERVMAAIDEALALGYAPVKVNVVVMKGVNDDELGSFVELTRRKNINVRFIEYMPFDGNVWSDEKMVRWKDMAGEIEKRGYALERLDDGYGEVAKNYRVPGFVGSVSFITSMTSAFCGECNRVRLMADGNIKVCLFGNNEVSLRDAIREGASDEDLLAVMSAAVDRKKKAHAGMDILHTLKNRPMVKIGG